MSPGFPAASKSSETARRDDCRDAKIFGLGWKQTISANVSLVDKLSGCHLHSRNEATKTAANLGFSGVAASPMGFHEFAWHINCKWRTK